LFINNVILYILIVVCIVVCMVVLIVVLIVVCMVVCINCGINRGIIMFIKNQFFYNKCDQLAQLEIQYEHYLIFELRSIFSLLSNI